MKKEPVTGSVLAAATVVLPAVSHEGTSAGRLREHADSALSLRASNTLALGST